MPNRRGTRRFKESQGRNYEKQPSQPPGQTKGAPNSGETFKAREVGGRGSPKASKVTARKDRGILLGDNKEKEGTHRALGCGRILKGGS